MVTVEAFARPTGAFGYDAAYILIGTDFKLSPTELDAVTINV